MTALRAVKGPQGEWGGSQVVLFTKHQLEEASGTSLCTSDNIMECCRLILQRGAPSVLVIDIHQSEGIMADFWSDGRKSRWIFCHAGVQPPSKETEDYLLDRIENTLTSGTDMLECLVMARFETSFFRRTGKMIPDGADFPATYSDFPWVTEQWRSALPPSFPGLETNDAGLYPIVNRLEKMKQIVPAGADMVQIRVKDLSGSQLEAEIAESIRYARDHRCRLFVNDYWDLAIKYGAYGVHLGQEDLATADLEGIRGAGLRLGISTHSYFEAAVAHGIRPSYVAFGPVFFTKLKAMRFVPQGPARLALWKRMLPYPVVAIGGITLDNAKEVIPAAPDFIAMVGDIANAEDPGGRTSQWLDLLAGKRRKSNRG